MMIIRTVLLFILLFLAGCAGKSADPTNERHLWDLSTPEAEGMNPVLLDSAFILAEEAGFVDGLLIIKNGFLVREKYYNEFGKSLPHNIMSVSKSFLSAIAGIALEQGFLDSLEEKALPYFPEYLDSEIDSAKYSITIRHLLTMRMGIKGEAADNYAEYWRLYNSDNWIRATIETPLTSLPGQKISYNTFQTHLLSAIITKATGRSTRAFAAAHLFQPMGIDLDDWERDPQGYYFGGNSMYFTPREMAVLGWLYLNNGRINEVQVVPSDWIALTLSPSTNFSHPNEWGGLKNYNYAYLWWLGEIGGESIFMGYGYGGQFVVVFPELNMVVVTTARNLVDPEISTNQELAIFNLIARYIVPAACQPRL